MTEVVIASAARTPVGSFNGGLSSLAAHDLGAVAIRSAMERAGIAAEETDEVVMGQILAAGEGQNPARQAAVAAGVPVETPAWGINQLCGSGLRAVAIGYQHVVTGDDAIVVAGGQESMSRAPHCAHLRNGATMGNVEFVDTMLSDGLFDAFNGYHMGTTAENVARQWQITRDQQDAFALASQQKASRAQAEGRFRDEVVAVTVPGRRGDTVVEADEYIRHDASAESLAKLRPAFDREEGTVTAGNASGINDGAAAVVLMSAADAERRGIEPMARIRSWATVGLDPAIMGMGPVGASRKALDKAGWKVEDLDLVEANEAFAAQACAVNKDMGWNPDIVNVNGGAIAIGHPIGASGARVLTTLLHEMARRGARKGLAALCIGGGMGVAMCVERA